MDLVHTRFDITFCNTHILSGRQHNSYDIYKSKQIEPPLCEPNLNDYSYESKTPKLRNISNIHYQTKRRIIISLS